MDIKELQTEFIISDVADHSEHKPILLDLINTLPLNPLHDVSKTDCNLPIKLAEKKYLQYFYSNIATPILVEQKNYFKAKKCDISNGWFQQYEEGSVHQYHNHPKANFSNVYFVELPDQQFKTSIKVGEKEYEYEVKEGQLITFPAHLLHCSKSNGNLRKTVIAFNSDFIY